MWKYFGVYNVFCVIITIVHSHDFRSFDDTILFKINWPGKVSSDLSESHPYVEPYAITTAHKEKYECLITDTSEKKRNDNEPYVGLNPIELMQKHLFKENACSYRVETYWSYELCHGKFARQYHEDRDGKKLKTQEFYLGTFDKSQEAKLVEEYAKKRSSPNRKEEIPFKRIDGINMPYLEVEMTDGTVCDLNNKPRKIKVLYVCYQHGKNELFSLEEPSSCEYEMIVLSSWICEHPDYEPQATGENEINCHPVENAPTKPKSLSAMEVESVKLRYQKDKLQEYYAVFHVDKEGQDGETHVRVEIHPNKPNDIEDSVNSLTEQGISPMEVSPVKNFLSGKNCLHGGNGWWKYEFCYGRSVVQYHIERDGKKSIKNLGKFDKQKHLEWVAGNVKRKPKSREERKFVSHFYGDGSICDETGNPRQTEVRLKCVESGTVSPSSVSLFLREPKICEYTLGVESPLICDILEYADDETGLFSDKLEVNFDKLKTTAFHEYDDLDERIANGDD